VKKFAAKAREGHVLLVEVTKEFFAAHKKAVARLQGCAPALPRALDAPRHTNRRTRRFWTQPLRGATSSTLLSRPAPGPSSSGRAHEHAERVGTGQPADAPVPGLRPSGRGHVRARALGRSPARLSRTKLHVAFRRSLNAAAAAAWPRAAEDPSCRNLARRAVCPAGTSVSSCPTAGAPRTSSPQLLHAPRVYTGVSFSQAHPHGPPAPRCPSLALRRLSKAALLDSQLSLRSPRPWACLRLAESEADAIGLRLMARACFDPVAAPRMLQKLSAREQEMALVGGGKPRQLHSRPPIPATARYPPAQLAQWSQTQTPSASSPMRPLRPARAPDLAGARGGRAAALLCRAARRRLRGCRC
jgi:hypothetical protein